MQPDTIDAGRIDLDTYTAAQRALDAALESLKHNPESEPALLAVLDAMDEMSEAATTLHTVMGSMLVEDDGNNLRRGE